MDSFPVKELPLSLKLFTASPVVLQDGSASPLIRSSPRRLFNPDGFGLIGSRVGGTALELSRFNTFVRQNSDLLQILDQDPELLSRAVSTGFSDRSDLLEILADGVASTLPADSPVTRRFLAENSQVTAVLALNLGGLRDAVISDPGVAESLVDGQTIQTAILKEVAGAAADAVGEQGGLDEAYFRDNPLAGAYLLLNTSEARRISADGSGILGESFRARFATVRGPIRDAVVTRASELLANPTGYSAEFLSRDETFTSLLVGAAVVSESGSVPSFLRERPDLTLERVDVSHLLRSYEVDRALRQLPGTGVLDERFLEDNVGLALVINRFPEVRDRLVQDLPRLNALQERLTRPGSLENGEALYGAFSRSDQDGSSLSFYY